ncbi:MAG: hypothetical protein ACP5KG_09370 [Myxococcota bacterium]
MRLSIIILAMSFSFSIYASTELMVGLNSEVINDKSFDIFSENDWVFGPQLKISQSIIAQMPLYLQIHMNYNSSSNKIFNDIKTEFSEIILSTGISYEFNILRDLLYLYCGANFIYGTTDIKLKEDFISYSDSSSTYGGSLFSGTKITIPVSIFRGEQWQKQHWHQLVTMGIDIQLGYRFLTPLKYEKLHPSSNRPVNTEMFDISAGEVQISGPYVLTSFALLF